MMAIEENIRNHIKYSIKDSIDSLEIAMNVIETSDDLNEVCDEEVDCIYKKLSSAINILRDI